MASSPIQRAVGVLSSHKAVSQALHDLKSAGFSMDRISLLGKDLACEKKLEEASEQAETPNKLGRGLMTGSLAGGTLGGIGGLLVGIGLLEIPLIGPLMLAGAMTSALATTIAGGAIGATSGGIFGSLAHKFSSEKRTRIYQQRLLRDKYLIVVEGTKEELDEAQVTLSRWGLKSWKPYDPLDAKNDNTDIPREFIKEA